MKKLLWSLVLLSLTACNYKLEKLSAPPGLDGSQSVDQSQVDFSMVLSKVIQPKCLECHSSAGGNRGGVNLETYAEVSKNLADVKADIEDGSMPKNRQPLSAAQKDLILNWIAAGAPEKVSEQPKPTPTPQPSPSPSVTPTPTPTPIPVVLDFATVKKYVIDTACLKCHSAPANRGDVNLETYAETIKNLSDIKQDVEDGSMPKRGTLTADQKSLILSWIAAGAPETVGGPAQPPQPTPSPTPVTPSPVTETLDFATVKAQVIDNSCLKCHSAPANRGGVNLETYAEAIKNIADIKQDVEDGSMPKRSTLTQAQKDLILNWIAAGAPEKGQAVTEPSPGVPANCDEKNMTKSFVKFVIDQKEQRHGQDDDREDGDPCVHHGGQAVP